MISFRVQADKLVYTRFRLVATQNAAWDHVRTLPFGLYKTGPT